MRLRFIACLALLVASCSKGAPVAAPVRSNVVWIIADGLRYDEAISMESYRTLAQRGTIYYEAKATASDCIASVGSMFTGLLPSEHGAHITRLRRNGVWTYHQQALQPSQRTIAEEFKELGYDTVLATSNLQFADGDLGISQGFDELLLSNSSATTLNTRIDSWLATHTDKPFFLVIDYADTRLGYAPAPGKPEPEQDSPEDSNRVANEIEAGILGGTEYSATELDLLKALYSDGVASVDFGITELLRSLQNKELFDSAVVVLSSDHGESLGEHNLIRHGRGAFEELLHVPLVIKRPEQQLSETAYDRISLLQLPSRVLELAAPGEASLGGGYFTQHASETAVRAEQYYAYPKDFGKPWSDRFDQVLRVHYHKQWKYIDSDEGKDQLYRVGEKNLMTASGAGGSSANELENLIEAHPGVAADMAMRIKRAYGEL